MARRKKAVEYKKGDEVRLKERSSLIMPDDRKTYGSRKLIVLATIDFSKHASVVGYTQRLCLAFKSDPLREEVGRLPNVVITRA